MYVFPPHVSVSLTLVQSTAPSRAPVSSLPLPVWACLDFDLAAKAWPIVCHFFYTLLPGNGRLCANYLYTTATYIPQPGMADCVPIIYLLQPLIYLSLAMAVLCANSLYTTVRCMCM